MCTYICSQTHGDSGLVDPPNVPSTLVKKSQKLHSWKHNLSWLHTKLRSYHCCWRQSDKKSSIIKGMQVNALPFLQTKPLLLLQDFYFNLLVLSVIFIVETLSLHYVWVWWKNHVPKWFEIRSPIFWSVKQYCWGILSFFEKQKWRQHPSAKEKWSSLKE